MNKTHKTMQVIGYIRVSTEEQKKNGHGLDEQRDILRRWEQSTGETIDEVFSDEGHTGSDQFRPALQEILELVKKEDSITKIVVPYFDRWARETFLHLFLEKEVKKHNVELESATEQNLNDDDPATKLYRTLTAAFAQYERERIAARMAGGRRQKAQAGKHATGRTPFGYEKNEDGELVINEAEAKTIRFIYVQRNKEGKSLRAIARMLNEAGLRTKQGNEWSANSVKYILENSKYRGVLKQKVRDQMIKTRNKDLGIIEN